MCFRPRRRIFPFPFALWDCGCCCCCCGCCCCWCICIIMGLTPPPLSPKRAPPGPPPPAASLKVKAVSSADILKKKTFTIPFLLSAPKGIFHRICTTGYVDVLRTPWTTTKAMSYSPAIEIHTDPFITMRWCPVKRHNGRFGESSRRRRAPCHEALAEERRAIRLGQIQ